MNVELFGLPGVGKSYLLRQFPNRQFIQAYPLSQRLQNVLIGFLHRPSFLIIIFSWRILRGWNPRPVYVLSERIGIRVSSKKHDMVFDECILQFVWRSLCELPNDPLLDKQVLIFLNSLGGEYIYIKTPKIEHIRLIRERKKPQRFDNSVLDNSFEHYFEGRAAMVRVLRLLRQSNWVRAELKVNALCKRY